MSKLNNKGLTLLEVIITITVIITGVLMLTKLFPIAFKVGESAKQSTVATNLAQAKLEEMFYLDYDNISIGTIEAKQRMSVDPANPFYNYQRETITEYIDQNLETSVVDTGMKKITVNSYWNSSLLSLEKSVQLTLIISEK